MEFPPCCQPTGRVTNSCAANVYRQRVEGFYRLAGAWTGWKIEGNKLVGPNGLRFTPQSLANAWASISNENDLSIARAAGRKPPRRSPSTDERSDRHSKSRPDQANLTALECVELAAG